MNSNHSSKPKGKAKPPKKGKKWYVSAQNIGFGSGERPKDKASKSSTHGGRRRDPLNLIQNAPYESNPPVSGNTQTVVQDELVANVSMTMAFSCVSYSVQPGLASMFPWLSQLSNLYQKYRIRRMRFYYKPTVSQYAALGSQGRIILSFDTDSASSLLVSLQQAEAMSPNVVGIPYENLSLQLPSSRSLPLWVRSGPTPAGTDIKTYDAGRLFITTQGGAADGFSGELRVAYEVDLYQPVLPNAVQAPVNFSVSGFYNTTPTVLTTGVETTLPTPLTLPVGNGLGITVGSSSLTMPQGMFRFSVRFLNYNTGANMTIISNKVTFNGSVISGSTDSYFGPALNQKDGLIEVIRNCNAGDTVDFRSTITFGAGTCNSVAIVYISLP